MADYSRVIAQLEEKAQALDLRRQDQIERQVRIINRLQDTMAKQYDGVSELHYPVTRAGSSPALYCRSCTEEVWPCETAKLFGIGSGPSSDDDAEEPAKTV